MSQAQAPVCSLGPIFRQEERQNTTPGHHTSSLDSTASVQSLIAFVLTVN